MTTLISKNDKHREQLCTLPGDGWLNAQPQPITKNHRLPQAEDDGGFSYP